MGFFNRKNEVDDEAKEIIENVHVQNERIKYEDDYSDNIKDINSEDKNYLIKILIPSDQYGTEYILYYIGENDTIVRNAKFAKSYDNFNIARSVSNDYSERYKKQGIWAPSRVIVDRFQ